MQPRGFEEGQAAYASDDPRSLIGQFRRLGEDGPAYEIMSLDGDGNIVIEIVESDERVTMPIAEVLEDPIAETIP